MAGGLLLDTCAALWLTTPETELHASAAQAMIEADDGGAAIHLSPITAWEVGQLVARGRYSLSVDPLRWFDDLLASGMVVAALTPEILVEASFLPLSSDLRDPADRILASTARLLSLTLMTRDRPLLDYAASGHIRAIRC